MTRGCTRKSATPIPLIAPTTRPRRSARPIAVADPEFGVGREQVSRSGRNARNRKVDAARQHHQGLSAGHDRKRRGEQNRVRGPERRHSTGPHELDADHESEKQQDQCIEGSRAQEREESAHLRSLR
jgi:hypothetical protein